MRNLIVSTLLLLIAGKLHAQTPQSFNPEPGVFIKEFETFIRGAAISTLEPELNKFLTDWNTGRGTRAGTMRFSKRASKCYATIC